MGLLHRRPLATVCLAFLAGMLLAALIGVTAKYVLAAIGLSAVIFLAIFPRRGRRARPLAFSCIAALLLAFFLGYLFFDRPVARMERYKDEEATILATVTDLRYQTDYSIGFYAETTSINGARESGKLYVQTYGAPTLAVGDTLTFTAHLSPVAGGDTYLRSDGVCALAEAQDVIVTGHSSSLRLAISAVFTDWRNTLSGYLTDCIPGENGNLMSAMLLGRRELLSTDTTQSFRRLGLSHVLAISGLHLGILCGVMFFVLTRLGVRHRTACLTQIGLVLFYMTLTAFPLSVVRAGIMLLFVSLAFLAAREPDGITSLSAAAALICLLSPAAVFDVGFWLSVVATFGILVYNELRAKRPKPQKLLTYWLGGLLGGAAVSLCATFATLPLMALFFGEISLLSPIANMLLTPLLEIYLILSLVALPLGWVGPIAALLGGCGEALLAVIRPFSRLRGALLSVDYVTVKILLFATVLAVFFCLCLPRPRHRVLWAVGGTGLALTALCLAVFNLLILGQNAVVYTKKGENEHLLLYQGGQAMLCDLTGGSYTAAKTGITAMGSLHLTELEGYYISHYHSRHPATFKRMAARTVIRHLYLPTPESIEEEALYDALCAMAAQYDIPCTRYEPYTPFAFGNMTVIPHAGTGNGKTHSASGISVRYADKMLTYLGSAYHESDLLAPAAEAVEESEYLLFGTHGPGESEPLSYRLFSAELALVLVADDTNRLPATLQAALDGRDIPYHEAGAWEYISFS